MTVSILVRLIPVGSPARRLAGEVELVATGERTIFRDADELLAILTARSDPQPAEARVEANQRSVGVSDA